MWQSWIAAIVGLWTVAVPFIGLSGTALMWTLVVTGAVVAVASFWAVAEEPQYSGKLERQTR